MKKIILLLIGAMLVNMQAMGQTIGLPINIQSPNAASLGTYGDIPMDLYTGRANVAIPIFNITEGGVPLNIGLHYDTGGLRVNDISGWVGQNWTLEAGGAIIRVVKGQNFDEYDPFIDGNVNSGWTGGRGYYYSHDMLNRNDWTNIGTIQSIVQNAGNTSNPKSPAYDLQPDIFIFNFMGYTGKFFLGEDGVWKVSSENNMKVLIDMSDNRIPMDFPATMNYNQRRFPKTITKITLIDDNGNKFIFGGTNMNAVEYSIPDFFDQLANPIIANAWYLTEVYNNMNQKVYTFTYTRGNNYIANFYNYSIVEKFSVEYNMGNIFSFKDGANCIGGNYASAILAHGQVIIPVYLQQITTLSGVNIYFNSSYNNALKYTVNDTPIKGSDNMWFSAHGGLTPPGNDSYFYYTNRHFDGKTGITGWEGGRLLIEQYLNNFKWLKLDAINITKSTSLKAVVFSYTNQPDKRLFLDSLTIVNSMNQPQTPEYKYKFEYYNRDLLPNSLASMSVDHFGYYKGSPAVVDYNNLQNYESTCQTNPATVYYGSLSKITYPTGGCTTFEYEPHDYSKCVDSDSKLVTGSGIIGGIRIKSMVDMSDNVNKIEKKYKYTQDKNSSISSGNLLQKNIYFVKNYQVPTVNNFPYYLTKFDIGTVLPMSNLTGTNIEYSTVIETISENGANGYVINNFTNYADYPDQLPIATLGGSNNIFDSHTEFAYKRGKIKSVQYFDNAGNKKMEEEYNYSENLPLNKVRGLNHKYFTPCPTNIVFEPVISGSAFEIYFSDFNLTSKKTRVYNNGQILESVDNYTYTAYGNYGDNLLKETATKNSNNKTITTSYIYPFEIKDGDEQSILQKMTDKNMISVYAYKFSYLDDGKIIDGEYRKFNEVYPNVIKPVQIDRLNSTNANINSIYSIYTGKPSAISASSFMEAKVFYKYNSNGNLVEMKPAGSMLPTTYLWSYNHRYPIAELVGASYDQVCAVKGGQTAVDSIAAKSILNATDSTTINNLRTQLSNTQVTTYTYKPLVGIQSMIDPKGVVTQYVYDNFGRLQAVYVDGKQIETYNYHYKNQ